MGLLVAVLIIVLECWGLYNSSGLKKHHKFAKGWWGYYTSLSNLLVLIYFILVLISKTFNVLSFVNNSVVNLSVTMAITLTFLIYHFLLSKADKKAYRKNQGGWNPYSMTNYLIHYICPLLTIFYWLVFGDKTNLVIWDGLWWLLIPLTYIFYAVIRAFLGYTFDNKGTRWPYDFMNFDKNGTSKTILIISILCVIFGLLGILMAGLSILIGR